MGTNRRLRTFLGTVCALLMGAAPAAGQLRVVTWNVTNYSSGRVSEFQTAIYGVFEGRTMAPDVFIGQEFLSQTGVNNFLSILNTAPGSPGDWAAAPFVNGTDTDNAFFYRTSKVDFLGATVIAVGSSSSSNQPRDTNRYDVRIKGYTSTGASIGMYSSHMKAQGGTNSTGRRLIEAQRIRDNAQGVNTNGSGSALPAGFHFLLGGDFNIQSSGSSPYIELVGSQANNDGRFFDPISTPGSWNNNSFYHIVHTQDPAGAGGMDDRHDQILMSASLVDGDGLDYVGNPAIPYSTTTWNDPNHSYRSWGNDGASYNTIMKIVGNTMVGATIAQALVSSANGQGHLPVFLDLYAPPRVDSVTVIDFGQAPQNSLAEETLTVTHDGDVALWSAGGIADLTYSLSASTGFTVAAGPFDESAGGGGNDHTIEMDTSTPGPVNGTVTILSNAPDEPSRVVMLIGEVLAPCNPCDLDCDNFTTIADVSPFVDLLLQTAPPCSVCAGDTNTDMTANAGDIQLFLDCLLGG